MLGQFVATWEQHHVQPVRSFAAAVEEIRILHLEAAKARASAVSADDDRISADLHRLAADYDREARRLNLVLLTVDRPV